MFEAGVRGTVTPTGPRLIHLIAEDEEAAVKHQRGSTAVVEGVASCAYALGSDLSKGEMGR